MASTKMYDSKIILLMLSGITLIASTNIDCGGSSFHCLNSTHFMICVDLGGGVSTTVDNLVIPCPAPTICKQSNRFECEFPAPTAAPVSTIELTTVSPTTSVVLDEFEISATTSLPWEEIADNANLPLNATEQHMEMQQINNTSVSTTDFVVTDINTIAVSVNEHAINDMVLITTVSGKNYSNLVTEKAFTVSTLEPLTINEKNNDLVIENDSSATTLEQLLIASDKNVTIKGTENVSNSEFFEPQSIDLNNQNFSVTDNALLGTNTLETQLDNLKNIVLGIENASVSTLVSEPVNLNKDTVLITENTLFATATLQPLIVNEKNDTVLEIKNVSASTTLQQQQIKKDTSLLTEKASSATTTLEPFILSGKNYSNLGTENVSDLTVLRSQTLNLDNDTVLMTDNVFLASTTLQPVIFSEKNDTVLGMNVSGSTTLDLPRMNLNDNTGLVTENTFFATTINPIINNGKNDKIIESVNAFATTLEPKLLEEFTIKSAFSTFTDSINILNTTEPKNLPDENFTKSFDPSDVEAFTATVFPVDKIFGNVTASVREDAIINTSYTSSIKDAIMTHNISDGINITNINKTFSSSTLAQDVISSAVNISANSELTYVTNSAATENIIYDSSVTPVSSLGSKDEIDLIPTNSIINQNGITTTDVPKNMETNNFVEETTIATRDSAATENIIYNSSDTPVSSLGSKDGIDLIPTNSIIIQNGITTTDVPKNMESNTFVKETTIATRDSAATENIIYNSSVTPVSSLGSKDRIDLIPTNSIINQNGITTTDVPINIESNTFVEETTIGTDSVATENIIYDSSVTPISKDEIGLIPKNSIINQNGITTTDVPNNIESNTFVEETTIATDSVATENIIYDSFVTPVSSLGSKNGIDLIPTNSIINQNGITTTDVPKIIESNTFVEETTIATDSAATENIIYNSSVTPVSSLGSKDRIDLIPTNSIINQKDTNTTDVPKNIESNTIVEETTIITDSAATETIIYDSFVTPVSSLGSKVGIDLIPTNSIINQTGITTTVVPNNIKSNTFVKETTMATDSVATENDIYDSSVTPVSSLGSKDGIDLIPTNSIINQNGITTTDVPKNIESNTFVEETTIATDSAATENIIYDFSDTPISSLGSKDRIDLIPINSIIDQNSITTTDVPKSIESNTFVEETTIATDSAATGNIIYISSVTPVSSLGSKDGIDLMPTNSIINQTGITTTVVPNNIKSNTFVEETTIAIDSAATEKYIYDSSVTPVSSLGSKEGIDLITTNSFLNQNSITTTDVPKNIESNTLVEETIASIALSSDTVWSAVASGSLITEMPLLTKNTAIDTSATPAGTLFTEETVKVGSPTEFNNASNADTKVTKMDISSSASNEVNISINNNKTESAKQLIDNSLSNSDLFTVRDNFVNTLQPMIMDSSTPETRIDNETFAGMSTMGDLIHSISEFNSKSTGTTFDKIYEPFSSNILVDQLMTSTTTTVSSADVAPTSASLNNTSLRQNTTENYENASELLIIHSSSPMAVLNNINASETPLSTTESLQDKITLSLYEEILVDEIKNTGNEKVSFRTTTGTTVNEALISGDINHTDSLNSTPPILTTERSNIVTNYIIKEKDNYTNLILKVRESESGSLFDSSVVSTNAGNKRIKEPTSFNISSIATEVQEDTNSPNAAFLHSTAIPSIIKTTNIPVTDTNQNQLEVTINVDNLTNGPVSLVSSNTNKSIKNTAEMYESANTHTILSTGQKLNTYIDTHLTTTKDKDLTVPNEKYPTTTTLLWFEMENENSTMPTEALDTKQANSNIESDIFNGLQPEITTPVEEDPLFKYITERTTSTIRSSSKIQPNEIHTITENITEAESDNKSVTDVTVSPIGVVVVTSTEAIVSKPQSSSPTETLLTSETMTSVENKYFTISDSPMNVEIIATVNGTNTFTHMGQTPTTQDGKYQTTTYASNLENKQHVIMPIIADSVYLPNNFDKSTTDSILNGLFVTQVQSEANSIKNTNNGSETAIRDYIYTTRDTSSLYSTIDQDILSQQNVPRTTTISSTLSAGLNQENSDLAGQNKEQSDPLLLSGNSLSAFTEGIAASVKQESSTKIKDQNNNNSSVTDDRTELISNMVDSTNTNPSRDTLMNSTLVYTGENSVKPVQNSSTKIQDQISNNSSVTGDSISLPSIIMANTLDINPLGNLILNSTSVFTEGKAALAEEYSITKIQNKDNSLVTDDSTSLISSMVKTTDTNPVGDLVLNTTSIFTGGNADTAGQYSSTKFQDENDNKSSVTDSTSVTSSMVNTPDINLLGKWLLNSTSALTEENAGTVEQYSSTTFNTQIQEIKLETRIIPGVSRVSKTSPTQRENVGLDDSQASVLNPVPHDSSNIISNAQGSTIPTQKEVTLISSKDIQDHTLTSSTDSMLYTSSGFTTEVPIFYNTEINSVPSEVDSTSSTSYASTHAPAVQLVSQSDSSVVQMVPNVQRNEIYSTQNKVTSASAINIVLNVNTDVTQEMHNIDVVTAPAILISTFFEDVQTQTDNIKNIATVTSGLQNTKNVMTVSPALSEKNIVTTKDTEYTKSFPAHNGISLVEHKLTEDIITLPRNVNAQSANDVLSESFYPVGTRSPMQEINVNVPMPTTEKIDPLNSISKKNKSTFGLDVGDVVSEISTSPVMRSVTNIKSAGHFSCQNRKQGKYSDNADCRKFYICSGIMQPIVGRCPFNTVFSEINKQCTKNLSHCIRENQFKCTTEGRFGDYLEKNIYYICVKNSHQLFVRFKFQCQNGYYLNKTTVKCVQEPVSQSLSASNDSDVTTEKKSSERAISKKSGISLQITNSNAKLNNNFSTTNKMKSENTSNNSSKSVPQKKSKKDEEFECDEEGKFPHPDSCRKYYVCSKRNRSDEYRRRTKKCDSDEVFHKDKKKCVDADSYEC